MPEKKQQDEELLSKSFSFGGVSLTQKAHFAKHLSVMIRAGMTIVDALEIIRESAIGSFSKVLGGVLTSVRSGQTLSSSFKRFPKVFSGIIVSATYAGETSGTLEENLENIAEQLTKEKELVGKIKGAMLYPVVVLVAAFALGLAMAFLVLPKITPLFTGLGVELPFTTRALIWFSGIVQEHGLVLFLIIVAVTTLLLWTIRQKFSHPVTHWIALRFPVIKHVVRNANLARFCQTLGMLLKSGLNIDEAISITEQSLGNHYFQGAMRDAYGSVSTGAKLSVSLAQHEELFPTMVTKMVRVGEASGELETVLLYLAEFYEDEVDTATKSLATAIEPMLLIFIGLIVGFLALSIITPIYNITGNIRR